MRVDGSVLASRLTRDVVWEGVRPRRRAVVWKEGWACPGVGVVVAQGWEDEVRARSPG